MTTKQPKTAPNFDVPNDRLSRAAMLTTGQGEDVTAPPAPAPKPELEKSHKACVRYMQEHGITDPSSLEFKRLNCEIPKDLHNFLNVFARSSNEYSSMTEIVIRELGRFAKEHGFKVEK